MEKQYEWKISRVQRRVAYFENYRGTLSEPHVLRMGQNNPQALEDSLSSDDTFPPWHRRSTTFKHMHKYCSGLQFFCDIPAMQYYSIVSMNSAGVYSQ